MATKNLPIKEIFSDWTTETFEDYPINS